MNPVPAPVRILVVDDSKEILRVLSRRLKSWDYEPLTANSGEEGLRIAEAQQPDIILLDIMMPKMKGRDVCAMLKANPATSRIPVMFLTALSLADHIRAGLEAGAEDYITKPFHPDDLRERLMVCLARHGRRPPPHSEALGS